MNVVVFLVLLSLVGTAHAQWEPLVAPQKLPRAPLHFLTQANQSPTCQSQYKQQEKQWPPQDTQRPSEAIQMLSHKTQWPLQETHWPLQETQWPTQETNSQEQDFQRPSEETQSLPHGTELSLQKNQSFLHQTQRVLQELPTFPRTWYPSQTPAPAALVPFSVFQSYSSRDSVNVTVNAQTGEVSVVKVTTENFKPGTLTSRLHQRRWTALLGSISGESATGVGLKSFHNPQPDDITFELYTRQNSSKYEALVATNVSSVTRSAFDARKWTVFISHGFTGDADHSPWMHAVKDEFLKKDVNIILVQWANLSSRYLTPLAYSQAVKNTKFVGAETGKLLHLLRDEAQLSADKLYLIGFSLGAHVVGFAGKAFPGIARITGLDPAGPLFDGKPASERLDKSDAKFVDVIHTNAELCGYEGSIGHVDFYVNGGRTQPDCSVSQDIGGCSHYRAHELFISSMKFDDRSSKGFQCPDITKYDAAMCMGNPFNNFGIHAQSSKPGDYYLKTLYINGDDHLYSSGRLASQLFLQARVGQVPDKDLQPFETLHLNVGFYVNKQSKDPVSTVHLTQLSSSSNPAGEDISALVTTPLQVPILDLVTRLSYFSNISSSSKKLTIQLLSFVISDTSLNKRYSACNVTMHSQETILVQFSDRECPSNGSTNPWYF